MNRSAFYAALRRRASGVFGTSLTQGQVDGCETILDEACRRGTSTNDAAYILATAYHETAHTMQPIDELGGRAYFVKYEPGTRIGKALGNILPGDGYKFRGRGYVQLTGRRNYELAKRKTGFDLVNKPDLALEPDVAVAILFDGMEEGWFTGRDLSDFIDTFDEAGEEDLREFIEARRIVNGTDKAALIGGYAVAFEHALREAGYERAAPEPAREDHPAGDPVPSSPPPVLDSRSPVAQGIAVAAMAVLAGVAAWGADVWRWLVG